MVTCYVAVGSNAGERRDAIAAAIQKIKALKDTKVIAVSRIIETEPVGGPPHQGKFLNACVKIKTALTPAVLLKRLKAIEQELGRRKTVRWGPRTIDLDILLYDLEIVCREDLRIPHPRMFERSFVLEPLSEIFTG